MHRSLLIGSLALIAGVGCHAGPQRNPAKIEAPVSRADVSATKFIAQHNRNAGAVHSLMATPAIVIVGNLGERRVTGRLNGSLALEEGKNFRLEIEAMTKRKIADIGSNERSFWFWADDDKENSIYVCDHKDASKTDIGMTLQPDWIMEAMGLRSFSEAEAQSIHTKTGEVPGTLVLTQFRTDSKGRSFTKETIVKDQSWQILEHRLYAGAKAELLASAKIYSYQSIKFPDADARDSDDPQVVQMPETFLLSWVKEKLTLKVSLASGLKINPTFEPEQRVALFSEPPMPGTRRLDLAKLDTAATAPSSRVYESRPAPKAGGISLGMPRPAADGMSRRAIEPVPLSNNPSASVGQVTRVVGAPIPTVE